MCKVLGVAFEFGVFAYLGLGLGVFELFIANGPVPMSTWRGGVLLRVEILQMLGQLGT